MQNWPTSMQVAPSILSADFGRMREQVRDVMDAGARVIHVDVMDGHFVPVITFGPKMLADIADEIHSHDGFADVHLMIENPERHLEQFAAAGADSITVHVETCPHLHYTLHQIQELGCRAGVTLNPATPVEAVEEAARYADVLLCMSVNPGWGGQAFIPATLDRLPRLREYANRRRGCCRRGRRRRPRPDGRQRLPGGREHPGRRVRGVRSAVSRRELPAAGRDRRGRRRRRLAVTGRHIDAVDAGHLARALELAERGRPTAAPNPVVGSVIVRDGRVLGEGWHVRPGGDHAEVAALEAAGDAAGATAYVSLEPCCHHGRTPPCTDALIAAGVARVVVAALDPSAKVDGRGVERLRAAGIDVDVAEGELEHAARRQNQPFRALHLLGRPLVTGKAAVSLDGATAMPPARSQWISSPESRALVHDWRAGIGRRGASGIGTALADDPMLTARDVDPPAERQPLRVVFDRRARLP